MSTKNNDFRNIELLEVKNGRFVTVWIIIVTTSKLFAVDISLFILSKKLQISSTDLRILMGTDTVLFGAIVRIMAKYYFPDGRKFNSGNL